MNITQVRKTYYKALNENGESPIAAHRLRWSLPTSRSYSHTPGMWHTVRGKLKPCRNGLHVLRGPKAIEYYLGGYSNRRLFACDVVGEVVRHGSSESLKYVCRTVRLAREVHRGSREWKLALRGTSLENAL